MMKNKTVRIILAASFVLILIGALWGFRYYKLLYKNNTKVSNTSYLYLPTGSNFNDLVDSLQSQKVLVSKQTFVDAAGLKNFSAPKAGRYKLTSGMTNSRLIRMFQVGEQAPVRLTLSGNIRTKEKLAGIASRYLEADSASIVATLNDDSFLEQLGVSSSNVLGLFILNTYEFYWNTSAEGFVKRMAKEENSFWNEKRESERKKTPYSRMEIATLASIVAEETIKSDEMPKVAGVYINRLNKNMLLQADPTVKYAVGDFSIKRVLTKHTEYDSPYNTYMYAGLPPGPICVPSPTAIDAVLQAEQHDYYYFCAKDDFSGYHAFAKTLAQHNQNAAAYHKALNRNSIYR